MTREELESEIVELMCTYDPDGHCDGYIEITDFIIKLLNNKTEIEWE